MVYISMILNHCSDRRQSRTISRTNFYKLRVNLHTR